MLSATRDAVLDQLADIACELDHLLSLARSKTDSERFDYAKHCVTQARELLLADDGTVTEVGMHRRVARILAGKEWRETLR